MRTNNTLHYLLLNIVISTISLFIQTQAFAQFTILNTKIEYVIDGDTFITTINNKKERIRMKCIDAPELKQTFKDYENKQRNIGIEAVVYLEDILKQQNNIITLKCNDGRDKYQRLTCEVLDNNQNSINLQMAKEGYAYAYPSYCFSSFESMMYIGYQWLARFSQAGLWGYGGWGEPWEIRKSNEDVFYNK